MHESCAEWVHEGRWQGVQVTISWVSGHDGITGNEMADMEAKQAISEGSSPWVALPDELQVDELPCSLAAAGSAFKSELKA